MAKAITGSTRGLIDDATSRVENNIWWIVVWVVDSLMNIIPGIDAFYFHIHSLESDTGLFLNEPWWCSALSKMCTEGQREMTLTRINRETLYRANLAIHG